MSDVRPEHHRNQQTFKRAWFVKISALPIGNMRCRRGNTFDCMNPVSRADTRRNKADRITSSAVRQSKIWRDRQYG